MSDLIPLEDTTADIVGKAMRGLKLADSEVAEKAGVSAAQVATFRGGEFDEKVARAVAPLLKLNANALVAMGKKELLSSPYIAIATPSCLSLFTH